LVKKRNVLLVILINILLFGALVTVYFTVFYEPRDRTGEWTLTISGIVDEKIVLTIENLTNMPSYTREYELQGNPTFFANYTGVKLRYLVTEVANITTNINVRVTAIDQYSYTMNLENQLTNSSEIIIAYLKNGDFIRSYYQGGEGPLRLIVPKEELATEWNGQYCVKFVSEIELLAI
jgi:DMSO/TMAO reductase YedYZ molybdopterin-dependent catalytic subunit